MRKMKDSSIEWIGKIPESWGVIRFKFLHDSLNTGEAIDKEHWTTDENDTVFYTAGLNPIRTNYTDFPDWKYTKENDLLLARNGSPYVYFPVAGACYTDHIIRADMKYDTNKKYIRYALQQSIMSIVVDSVSIATWSASLWNEQAIPYPALSEQTAITAHLDRQCSLIDDIIEKTKASIEEYKKLRQAVITQAVTRGVRGDRPKKDSGIEWIGEIPEEWETTKLGRISTLRSGITLGRKIPNNVNLIQRPYLRVANVQNGFVDTSTVTTLEVTEEEDIKYRLHKDDVLMTEGGDRDKLGRGCVWDAAIEPCLHQNHIFALKTNQAFLNQFYFAYVTASQIGRVYFDITAIKTTNLACTSSSKVTAFRIPLPSLCEQQEIVTYLDQKCAAIATLITKKETFLKELEVYKKSMIYEYVTGKKEVTP